LRIVAWNIRAGAGVRWPGVASQIDRWAPDLVALCEFRATPPSAALARALAERGLVHQLGTADPEAPAVNRLLIASRWPLSAVRDRRAPREVGRWLLASVAAPVPFTVGAMHVPNRVTGRKWGYLDAVLRLAERWQSGPAVLLGDTNSGMPGIDEEVPAFNQREAGFIEGLERSGWRDVFRHHRGEERSYTWYSPNGGNGFRIDQAFVNRALLPRLSSARYEWGRRRPGKLPTIALSDHAALLVDLDVALAAPSPRIYTDGAVAPERPARP
jgi:exonuclease III